MKQKTKSKKSVVKFMINLYCKNHHNSQNHPCESCQDLIDYSCNRIEKCPNIKRNITCDSCSIHCYNQEMQQQIKKVMKYSGPRMIFHRPLTAISHLIRSKLLN